MPSRSEEELRRRIAEGSQDLDDYVDLSDALASAALRQAGRLAEAEETVVRALALSGGRAHVRPSLLYVHGVLQLTDGRAADARASFESVLAELAAPETRRHPPEFHYSLGRYEAARASYVQVLDSPGAMAELRESAGE
ncbi:MAG: hypothetical protein ACREMB_04235 [Candidatus Rokuibacteriota bacterium]